MSMVGSVAMQEAAVDSCEPINATAAWNSLLQVRRQFPIAIGMEVSYHSSLLLRLRLLLLALLVFRSYDFTLALRPRTHHYTGSTELPFT